MTVTPFGLDVSGSFEVVVEWARPSLSGTDTYDNAGSVYDTAVYDGSGTLDWRDISEFVRQVSTRRGKERFGRRFRTGTMTLLLDNPNGIWLVDSNGMAPGDYVRLRVIVVGSNVDGLPKPIPDNTQWMDQAVNVWSSHGMLILDDDVEGETITYDLFYGRINSAQDMVRGGVDVTRFEVIDQMGSLAVIDKAAGATVGAGELSDLRMQRILDNAGQGFEDLTVLGTAQHTMAGTTLGKNALEECLLTAETEGGDFWLDTVGNAVFGTRDWLTTETRSVIEQASFGASGIGVVDTQPIRELQIVVNDATFSNTGGVSQRVVNAASVARFSNRTTRRLDLLGDQDTDMQFLAARAVANLSRIRPRARIVEVSIDTTAAATTAATLRFGDLVRSSVDSIYGWGFSFQAHVVSIEHTFFDNEWDTVFGFDDAFVQNETDGAYNNQMFSSAFNLGEA